MTRGARILGLVTLAALACGVTACRRGTPVAGGGSDLASDVDAAGATPFDTNIDGGSLDPDATQDAAGPADADPDADAGTPPVADAAPDAPYATPPICPAVLALGTGTVQPMSTQKDDRGLSVTPDQLTAAWLTTQGGEITLHYVDRALVTAAFGPAKTVHGAFASDRVALTPDGLGVAVTNDDRLGFSILRRAQRVDDFGAPEVGPFSVLDAQGQSVLGPAGEHYGDPLFALSAEYFVFSRYGDDPTVATVYLASRIFPTDPYSPGTPFGGGALAPVGDKRRIVTGASVDMRTLFVWDESTSTSVAVRVGPTGAIEGSTDVGARRDLQPSAACDAFWFTADEPGQIYRTP